MGSKDDKYWYHGKLSREGAESLLTNGKSHLIYSRLHS